MPLLGVLLVMAPHSPIDRAAKKKACRHIYLTPSSEAGQEERCDIIPPPVSSLYLVYTEKDGVDIDEAARFTHSRRRLHVKPRTSASVPAAAAQCRPELTC